MNNLFLLLISSILIGIGATITFDLWVLFLKFAFKIPPSNMCLVGRWVLYMQEGIFKHSNINTTPHKSMECTVGWVTHYLTGVIFAVMFLTFVGNSWIQHPILIAALIFGVITVSAPFFIMQPLFGLGFAASKTSHPTQARLRSLMNHTVFGFGLYFFGLLVNMLI